MKKNNVNLFVAWRYLRSTRREGFVAVVAGFSFLGILLGVMTLIVVMSVMNGFRHELMHRILGFNSHLIVRSYDQDIDLDTFPRVPGMQSTQGFFEKQGLCIGPGGKTTGAIVRGIEKKDLAKKPLVTGGLKAGSLDTFQDNAVVLGRNLAESVGANVGDTIKIMTTEGNPTPLGLLPEVGDFQVGAIFDSGMAEYDSAFLFMPMGQAADFFHAPGLKMAECFLDNPDTSDTIKSLLAAKMKKQGYGAFEIHDWKETNRHFFKALRVQSQVMFLILTLIVVVAVFNVVSCLVMLVKDKTQDIAVLRTLGARKSTIMSIFFLTGAFIGVGGTLVGAALGLGLAYHIDTIRRFLEYITNSSLFQAEIYFLSSLPSRVDMVEVAYVITMALALSFLATLYPAWKAASLSPVEGLRYS